MGSVLHSGQSKQHKDSAAYHEAAERLRAEARRIADVHHDLHHAMLHRVWRGDAATRFAASIDRRLRELDDQRLLLLTVAGQLDETATGTGR